MEQNTDEMDKLLSNTCTQLDKISEEDPHDFIKDVNLLYATINNNKYKFGFESFWNYFMSKYSIDKRLKKYFSNDMECAKMVYYHCITPLNLKLDIMALTIKKKASKTDLLSLLYRLCNNTIKTIRNIWLSIIAFLLVFLFIVLSFISFNYGNVWESNLFMGLATGVFVGIVIKFINTQIKNHLRKLEATKTLVVRFTEYFTKQIEIKYSAFENATKTRDNKNIIVVFVDINNLLKEFLDELKNLKEIKSFTEYHKLKSLEIDIFDYSSKVVQKLSPFYYHKLTNSEIDNLKLYLIDLRKSFDEYLIKYNEYVQNIDFEITRTSSKLIM